MSKDSIEQTPSVLEAEKTNLPPRQHQRLTELANAGKDVRLDVTGTLGVKEESELTPEQTDRIIRTLKSRFKRPANKKLRKTVNFADVEKSLRAAPEKLYALQKLEETGGKPQLVKIERDDFVFEDRSAQSPSGRRDLNFDQAAAQAKEFGVDMQSPEAYKDMQETGKYDFKSGSWLKTDPEQRDRTGSAMHGFCDDGAVYVYMNEAERHDPSWGWRASLRVKIV